MGISFNLADAVSGLFAKILGSGVAPQTTDNALVVVHRPDDPLLAQPFTFVTGQGGQLALNQNLLLAAAGAGSYDTGANRSVALSFVPASGTVTAGAVTFEGSNDDTNWVAVSLYDRASPAAAPVSSFTLAAGVVRYFAGDVLWKKIRARISTGVTGTTTGIQCFAMFSTQDYTPSIFMVRLTDGTNVSPTMDAVARKGFIQLTDGVSAQAVKAASTAAVAADPAAVVALSPNLPNATAPVAGVAAASINATVVKAAAGNVYSGYLWNASAAVRYVKFYNKATAPAPATDAALLIAVVPIAAGAGVSLADVFGATWGTRFASGISFATVTGAADTDATAVALGDVRWTINYL